LARVFLATGVGVATGGGCLGALAAVVAGLGNTFSLLGVTTDSVVFLLLCFFADLGVAIGATYFFTGRAILVVVLVIRDGYCGERRPPRARRPPICS